MTASSSNPPTQNLGTVSATTSDNKTTTAGNLLLAIKAILHFIDTSPALTSEASGDLEKGLSISLTVKLG